MGNMFRSTLSKYLGDGYRARQNKPKLQGEFIMHTCKAFM